MPKPRAAQSGPRASASQSPALNNAAPADGPGALEAELRDKERQLGANHVEVAETCSALAIVHNQNGDHEAARPLYERALRIWEAAKGPDCADVAHTLTDLAVLHLEQGNDEIGRPLLERALAIQERELGPDHPDVEAIRAVLEGDEE